MSCIKQKAQWNKEFDGDIGLFLKTAESYDLLKALVRFSCNNTSINCKHCPLASHNTSPPGRIDRLWDKHGWCGVALVAQDTFIGKGNIGFASFGCSDGSLRRMLQVSAGISGIDWRWWHLRDLFLQKGDDASYLFLEEIKWGTELFDIARFLFEFMPMWENRNDS